jgi:hypothetical protein
VSLYGPPDIDDFSRRPSSEAKLAKAWPVVPAIHGGYYTPSNTIVDLVCLNRSAFHDFNHVVVYGNQSLTGVEGLGFNRNREVATFPTTIRRPIERKVNARTC